VTILSKISPYQLLLGDPEEFLREKVAQKVSTFWTNFVKSNFFYIFTMVCKAKSDLMFWNFKLSLDVDF